MEKLLRDGWRIELFLNKLESLTAVATKGDVELVTDEFHFWPLVSAICDKIDKHTQEENK